MSQPRSRRESQTISVLTTLENHVGAFKNQHQSPFSRDADFMEGVQQQYF